MITPLDIQNKEFSRAVRGYNQEEVDLFLDEIMADYDKLISENQELKRQLEETKGKVDSYKDTEGAVLKTLEAAKSLMNDISASAEKRASILVKNAELDADLKQRQARDHEGEIPQLPGERTRALRFSVRRYFRHSRRQPAAGQRRHARPRSEDERRRVFLR